MYNHLDERSGLKTPLIADDVYEIIMKNVKSFDTAIKVVLQSPWRKDVARKKRHRRSVCSIALI